MNLIITATYAVIGLIACATLIVALLGQGFNK